MSISWKRALRTLSIACLAALPRIVGGQDAPAPPAAERLEIVLEDEPAGRAFLFTQLAAPAADPASTKAEEPSESADPASEYWIGVQLEPLPEIITSQLKLERGMVVVQVFEDSPAAKAELKTNDIIVRAGEKDVKGPDDLISAVNEAQTKELEIVVLRGGTETTLKVTPEKRSPERVELQLSPNTPHGVVVRTLDQLYSQAPDGEVRLFALRPGAAYAFAQSDKLPDNLEITIEKRGDNPARIRVTKVQFGEDKTWTVTEDKLDELPEDIRGHVQNMLGSQDHAVRQVWQQKWAQKAAQTAPGKQPDSKLGEYRVHVRALPRATAARQPAHSIPQPRAIIAAPAQTQIESKLDAILRKLEGDQTESVRRLQEELEKLRKEVEALRQEKK